MGFTQLVGLDLSEELLQVGACDLAQACTDAGQSLEGVRLVRSDMRSIPYEDHFATVLSLFTSFGYFEEDRENQAVLWAVHSKSFTRSDANTSQGATTETTRPRCRTSTPETAFSAVAAKR